MADPGLVSIVGAALTGAAMVGAALTGAALVSPALVAVVAGVVSTAAAFVRVPWTAIGVRARRGGTVAAAFAGGRVADARGAAGCVAFTATSGLRVRRAAVADLRDGPAVTARARRAGAFGRPTAGGRVLVVPVGCARDGSIVARNRSRSLRSLARASLRMFARNRATAAASSAR
jgi:hypothetical protein